MRLVRIIVLLLSAIPAAAQTRSFIVEFSGATLTSSSLHAQLRRDLASEVRAAAAGTPRVVHEYQRAFNGAAIEGASDATLARLRALPYVRAVHPDGTVREFAASVARVPPQSQRVAAGGVGVTVAVIDSGIDYRHEAFGNGFGTGHKVRGGWDFVNADSDPMDDRGHGTHVAGIVAGNGGGVTGVAPDAVLLAYKVLDSQGQGSASNIIAAIERAMDPDGDGNPSDRADVINLSLGGPGGSDDPLSRAVDAASAAGIVVCAAAGNSGDWYDVGSPGGARSAITVGAAHTSGELAEFSSRGPSVGGLGVKPEVLAPGVSISSAAVGGGSIVRSGTSMAAPYVAGIAALLVEMHPSWTPARVKSAIVNSAAPTEDDGVMAQGAGNVSRLFALAMDVAMTPAALNFEIVAPLNGSSTVKRPLSLTNHGTETRRFTIANVEDINGITVSATPREVELAAGASATIDVALAIDHPLPDPGPSFTYGGWLRVVSGTAHWNVPWSFVYSARATTTFDGWLSTVLWSGTTPGRGAFRQYAANAAEALLPPGTYDSVIIGRSGTVDVIVAAEGVVIAGDERFERSLADAPHSVTLRATTESGLPLDEAAGRYRATARLLLPETSIEIAQLASRTIRVSPLGNRLALLASEALVDVSRQEITLAQHAALRGLDGSRDLHLGASDFDARNLTLHFPSANPSRNVNVIPRWIVPREDEVGRSPLIVELPAPGLTWTARVRMSRETDPSYATGISMFAFERFDASGGPTELGVPTIRRDTNGFFSTNAARRPSIPVDALDGETFAFGEGALRPFFRFEPANRLYVTSELYGLRGETRRKDRARLTYSLRGNDGAELAAGPAADGTASAILPGAGNYQLNFEATTPGVGGVSSASMTFDTRRDDSTPPNLTSLAFLDASGKHLTRAIAGRALRVVFSAGDYSFANGSPRYGAIDVNATRVSWRRRGENAWQSLAAVKTGEDAGGSATSSIPAPGVVYTVDLSAATALASPIDLRIEIADQSGNTTSWTMQPGLFVDPSAPIRRRVAR